MTRWSTSLPHICLVALKAFDVTLPIKVNHMGNYFQWAPSLGEFTDVHFPKRRGSLFFDLSHGDKIETPIIHCWSPFGSIWYVMFVWDVCFSLVEDRLIHITLKPYLLPLPAYAHPYWDKFWVPTMSWNTCQWEFGRGVTKDSNEDREQ